MTDSAGQTITDPTTPMVMRCRARPVVGGVTSTWAYAYDATGRPPIQRRNLEDEYTCRDASDLEHPRVVCPFHRTVEVDTGGRASAVQPEEPASQEWQDLGSHLTQAVAVRAQAVGLRVIGKGGPLAGVACDRVPRPPCSYRGSGAYRSAGGSTAVDASTSSSGGPARLASSSTRTMRSCSLSTVSTAARALAMIFCACSSSSWGKRGSSTSSSL